MDRAARLLVGCVVLFRWEYGKGDEKKEEKEVETNKLDATKYLNRLRMEMQEKGDIASTVVPIEVSECCVFLDITVFVLASHIIICEG